MTSPSPSKLHVSHGPQILNSSKVFIRCSNITYKFPSCNSICYNFFTLIHIYNACMYDVQPYIDMMTIPNQPNRLRGVKNIIQQWIRDKCISCNIQWHTNDYILREAKHKSEQDVYKSVNNLHSLLEEKKLMIYDE